MQEASARGQHPAHEDLEPPCGQAPCRAGLGTRSFYRLCPRKLISRTHEKKLVLLLFIQPILPTQPPDVGCRKVRGLALQSLVLLG